ncbi:MAG: corrinoid protein [Deltaproteobacteria bacterium]|nr:corrinoid protein [Deltaproteobacteria bacterium]MBW2238721.1 corrinoid protein [Deltaproteobacteria bacterium]MBW2571672.1 corrinoid protein [Deltaproteobacteria bacterium]MBW2669465.1 corrinoid protein [Deltaproteobacteria bacterium]MBW2711243.1 corrinoid protein [Deltaproteobacteria bacterium]
MATKEELFEILKQGVIDYQEEPVKEASQQVLDDGYLALEAIMDGLAAGMEVVGDLYERHEYFVPEVLMCADALYAGLAILRPHVPKAEGGSVAQVVIGSIQGDVHDIGKNLVKMMFDVAGWEVYDLGRDVPLESFVEEQLRTDADVVAMSAMMTTTMLGMKKVIKMIKDKNPNVAIMLGGAPVTQDVATLFGADGYAESAGNAVAEGIKMIARLREYEKKKHE